MTARTWTCAGNTLGRPCTASITLDLEDDGYRISPTSVQRQYAHAFPLHMVPGAPAWVFEETADILIGAEMTAVSASGVNARCALHRIPWESRWDSPWAKMFDTMVNDLRDTLVGAQEQLGLPLRPIGAHVTRAARAAGGDAEMDRRVRKLGAARGARGA